MYGLVNLAIEEAVLERYGQKFWDYIKQCCRDSIGDTDGTFISRLFYDDEVTYRLIDTAERILRSEKFGHVSQLFGEKFYELVQDSGYEGILKLLGGSLKEFLDNLDSFHKHLGTTYSRMKPPSFRCSYIYEEDGHKIADKLILHYYSERIGLEGIVMGMVKASARELHGIKVDVSIYKLKLVDQGIDHTEFLITILGPYEQATKLRQATTNNQEFYDDYNLYEDDSFTFKNVKQLSNAALTNKVSPLVFAQALPFHLIFNRDLIVQQAGTSILRVIPALNRKRNVRLTDVMNMLEPKCLRGKLNFENILKYINSVYVFRPDEKQVISGGHRHLHGDYLKSLIALSKEGNQPTTTATTKSKNEENRTMLEDKENNDSNKNRCLSMQNDERLAAGTTTVNRKPSVISYNDCELSEKDIDKYIVKLMGQMTYMADKDLMLFVCSPSVANLDDLNNTGLFLSDIPLHDATRDLVLLSEQFEAEYKVQKKLTMLTEQLNVMKNELEEEKKKTDRLLYSVLPPTVANELRNERPVPAKKFQPVTILFSGIVGFSDFCAKNSDSSGAIRIVNLLNKVYTTFDVLTEPKRNPYVYKVETVGDKYMAVSGLPEACDSHARHINRLALDILDLAKTIKLEEYTGIKTKVPQANDTVTITGSGDGNRASDNNKTENVIKSSDQQKQSSGIIYIGGGGGVEYTQMDQCEHLRVTIGVHCGEVVTGVIGKRTPRYCLFGNTVNLTSRCETTGKKGHINVSQDVYNLCTKDPNNFDPEFDFQYRGQINMKGKSEPMGMWILTRRRLH